MIFNSPPENLISRQRTTQGCAEGGLYAWPLAPICIWLKAEHTCHVPAPHSPLCQVSQSPLPSCPPCLGPWTFQKEYCSQLPADSPDSSSFLHRTSLVLLAGHHSSAQMPSRAPYCLFYQLLSLCQGPLPTSLPCPLWLPHMETVYIKWIKMSVPDQSFVAHFSLLLIFCT